MAFVTLTADTWVSVSNAAATQVVVQNRGSFPIFLANTNAGGRDEGWRLEENEAMAFGAGVVVYGRSINRAGVAFVGAIST
jgi:hypothetical protein